MSLVVVTGAQEIERAVSALKRELQVGAELVHRTVTFPGTHGPIRDAEIIWRREDGFWGFFRTLPARFWCAFGTALAGPGEALNITVEVNPPRKGVNRSVYGQIVADETGGFHLAHKGGLGGGRGGTVTIEAFWRSFQNGERNAVTWKEDGHEAKMYLIGKIGSPDLPRRLGYFIREAERIRHLAKTGQLSRQVT